jgi:serine phosphatase RsbU (regulator of sigma subunit)
MEKTKLTMEIIDLLERVSIFSNLGKNELEAIAKHLIEVHVIPDEIIVNKGEMGDSMFIIYNGSVKVHDGDHIFTILKREQFFGEFSIFDSRIRLATVSAIEETDLLKLDQKSFYEITALNPIVTRGIIKSIVNRLSDKDKLEEELAQKNKLIQQQKEEIEAQRDKVVLQNEEIILQKKAITDSIRYASRIQSAVLPPKELLNKFFPSHFIFYKPRDIVSGDFYWFREIAINDSYLNVIAAADCTGHGVPGAFMSMLGISFLNEIVNNLIKKTKIHVKASDVLNQLRKQIIDALNQPGKEKQTQDGMDIALCIFNPDLMELQFAGANNSMYLIKEGEFEKPDESQKIELITNGKYTLFEYKADKMPIGIGFKEEKPYKNRIINVETGDTIYIFSDGYFSQFGGPNGKKFLSKHFKNLILSIQDHDLNTQKQMLEINLENWMGYVDESGTPHEQIDDIIVIGFKV